METSAHDHLDKGLKALRQDDTLVALVHFENAFRLDPTPATKSGLGYCLAKERRQFQKALALCQKALKEDPNNPQHYYQMGRIYLLAKQKESAIAIFRKGLKLRRYQPIIDELQQIGFRKPPVFASLAREHLLNRCFGRFLSMTCNR